MARCSSVFHFLPPLSLLAEFAQTHVHRVGDAIQPSHPLSPPSPPALNLSHPTYSGVTVEMKALLKWVDGGFTNSLPVLPAGRTVTISPFSGRLDVSPQDKGRLHFYVSITNQDVLLSVANLVRLNQALFPPSRRTMESLYQLGFEDASRFLRKESWFE
ncbi:hypothetical protein FD755_024783 [Muntiacus reevesi]|uniref:PNPLA domain-containing protein n=1 Tax=Muntiacus reevesi TaxID=9886 RepID=A0A5N3UTZ5_MUNRE|nr:hypothetical protein FD755_024783 [Muntiacus reevesi]